MQTTDQTILINDVKYCRSVSDQEKIQINKSKKIDEKEDIMIGGNGNFTAQITTGGITLIKGKILTQNIDLTEKLQEHPNNVRIYNEDISKIKLTEETRGKSIFKVTFYDLSINLKNGSNFTLYFPSIDKKDITFIIDSLKSVFGDRFTAS